MPPIHPRLRRDLTWRRFMLEGQDTYIFKDEIRQEYVKLDAVSGTLALQLDGGKSTEDLLAFARSEWPGLQVDADYIADVVADLKRMRFLEDPFERNAMLAARARQERTRINASTFRNMLSIPVGTVDPDRFLTRTYPYVAFLFQPRFVWLGLALFTLAGYLVLLNREHAVTAAGNILLGEGNRILGALLVWVTITGAIIVHELGHGYAVKHHGGKVHRLGFLLFFGIPCMFCDTSDSHLFPSWKHRMHVALAGTYTELYVAAFATLVWLLTPSDLVVNQLAYNVMLFASVSGIVFNYNPLVKMDGYFVLADILDMPNLMEDAYAYLGYLVRRYALRLPVPCPVEGRRRKRVLALYGILSVAYTGTFIVIVYVILRNLLITHLAFLGALLSLLLIAMLAQRPMRPLLRTARLWVLDHRGAIRRHLVVLLGGGAALLGACALVPVSARRTFDLTIEPARVQALVAPEAMVLREARFQSGQEVAAGDLIATLAADSAIGDLRDVEFQRQSLAVASRAARRLGEEGSAVATRERAAAEGRRAGLLERRVRRAELRAPFDGRVMTVFEPDRVGALLAAGDTVCVVGDFRRVRALVRVEDIDLEDVRAGAPARVRLWAAPRRSLRGRVAAVEPVGRGGAHRAWIALDQAPPEARAGMTGRAWVATPWRPVLAHLWRWGARFVRLDLWV